MVYLLKLSEKAHPVARMEQSTLVDLNPLGFQPRYLDYYVQSPRLATHCSIAVSLGSLTVLDLLS